MSTPETADLLRKARALYASAPAHCGAEEFPAPGTFCPITACNYVLLYNRLLRSVLEAYVTFGDCAERQSLPELDEKHSTEHVLWVFDRAIARAEGREPAVPRYTVEARVMGGWYPWSGPPSADWADIRAAWDDSQAHGSLFYRVVQVS